MTELLWIKRWDFKGGRISIARPADCAAASDKGHDAHTLRQFSRQPAQPHRPPRRVQCGPESTDGMGDLWLQFVARSPEDTGRLATSYREHEPAQGPDRG